MEVILLERIDKLGQMGDVVKVKSGYARNYLLPQKKALRATEANKSNFEQQRTQLEASNLERRQEAEKLSKKMEGLAVILIRQAGEGGQLYGSVNARDIAGSVSEAGFTISRQQVGLDNPIKALGLFEVHLTLHPEVSINVIANVARSKDEAKTQAKTGKAVVSADVEEAAKVPDAEPEIEAKTEAKTKKPKAKKAKAAEIDEEKAKAVETAANEAVAEQAEEIFEEGALPVIEPEPEEPEADAPGDEVGDETGGPAGEEAGETGEAPGGPEAGGETGKKSK